MDWFLKGLAVWVVILVVLGIGVGFFVGALLAMSRDNISEEDDRS
jgi:Na+/H+-dicarboxylate symporter